MRSSFSLHSQVAPHSRTERGVDDLGEDEALVLYTRSERLVLSPVAKLELRALRDSVHVRVPDELDGVTNGSVSCEGNVAENTLGRCDDDGVGCASAL